MKYSVKEYSDTRLEMEDNAEAFFRLFHVFALLALPLGLAWIGANALLYMRGEELFQPAFAVIPFVCSAGFYFVLRVFPAKIRLVGYRDHNMLTVERATLFGSKTETYALDDIGQVAVELKFRRGRKRRLKTAHYSVVVAGRDGPISCSCFDSKSPDPDMAHAGTLYRWLLNEAED